jgi:hypothetical protein
LRLLLCRITFTLQAPRWLAGWLIGWLAGWLVWWSVASSSALMLL